MPTIDWILLEIIAVNCSLCSFIELPPIGFVLFDLFVFAASARETRSDANVCRCTLF